MLKKEYLIYKLSEAAREACKIDNELFPMYNVKRGLRNEDGSGVLVGLTQVGNVVGYELSLIHIWESTGFTLLDDPLRAGYYSEIDMLAVSYTHLMRHKMSGIVRPA